MTDVANRRFLDACQERKQDEVQHTVLDYRCRITDLPLIQARLLARAVRGDIETYPPYLWR